MTKIFQHLKKWARHLKSELNALQIAVSKDLVPWHVKLLIILTIGYALSPIDLIPDFIPIIGLLDDIILIPVAIHFILQLIPSETIASCRKLAKTTKFNSSKNWIAGILIIGIWVILGVYIARQVLQ